MLVAPFKIVSGANRVTLLAHLEPPNGNVTELAGSASRGGTIVLPGTEGEAAADLQPHRDRHALRYRQASACLLTQADISNGEIGVAGTGTFDYSGEPRLQLGFAGTPMSASALKRMWPVLIVPEVREWVIERIESGTLQRIEIAINSPVRNLVAQGPADSRRRACDQLRRQQA